MRRYLGVGLALALLVLATAPAVTTRLYASDEVQYYVYLRSLWFDRDVSFDNEYRSLYDAGIARTDGFRETLLERTTATGRRLNFATIGCALLWTPFYAAADAWVHAARWFGSPVSADGYSRPYIAAACYASAFYGWLALLLSGIAASRVVRSGDPMGSLRAALLVLFGTPLVFYMYVAPPFAHATSAFAVSAFTLAWLHVRHRWSLRGAAVLGALAALVVLVREQDAFVLLGPAVDFAWLWLHRPRRRLLATASVTAVVFAIAWLPQAAAYVALNGRVGPSPLLTRKMTWWSPHAAGVLLSPDHGLLWWTPLVVFALAGLVLLALRPPALHPGDDREIDDQRVVPLSLLAMFAGHLYVTGCVASWTLAGAFGQRRFVALTPVLAIGLAVLLSRVRAQAARIALGGALAVCVWWNLALMVEFGAGLMDRQRLEIGRNARVAFVELPLSLPRLAYRYFFDRQSFYRPPPPST